MRAHTTREVVKWLRCRCTLSNTSRHSCNVFISLRNLVCAHQIDISVEIHLIFHTHLHRVSLFAFRFTLFLSLVFLSKSHSITHATSRCATKIHCLKALWLHPQSGSVCTTNGPMKCRRTALFRCEHEKLKKKQSKKANAENTKFEITQKGRTKHNTFAKSTGSKHENPRYNASDTKRSYIHKFFLLLL